MDNSNENTNILSALSSGLADAVERVGPALVVVNGRQRLPGSGVVYAENLIITADHVIEREEDLSVETQDGRKLAAQFVGRDPSSDIAVLKVDGLNITPATAGEPA